MNDKIKLVLRAAAAVFVVTLMVMLSELLGEKEVLFPETAAIALGALTAERMPWRITPVRMMVLMSAGGFAGFLLSAYVGIPLYPKIIAAFVFCCIVLYFSGSTMLPMISAAVLPVLTDAESILYPLSVIILTSMILLIQYVFDKTGIRKADSCNCVRAEAKPFFLHWCYLLAVLMITAAVAVASGRIYIIAPPLIVAFAELSEKESPVRKSPVQVFLCVSACALTGAVSRLLLCNVCGMPLTAGAFAAAALSVSLLLFFGKPFPPAAALSILPFILPPQELAAYPFEVMAGMAFFTAAAVFCGSKPAERLVSLGAKLCGKVREKGDGSDEILS